MRGRRAYRGRCSRAAVHAAVMLLQMSDAVTLAAKVRTWGSTWSQDETLEVVDHVWDLVVAAEWDFSVLDRIHRSLAAAYRGRVVEEQVQNGGYFQYFWNGYAPLAADTAADFELMGLTGLTDVQRDAVSAFGVVAEEIKVLREADKTPYGVAGPYQEGLALEDFEAQDRAWDAEHKGDYMILDCLGDWLGAQGDLVSEEVLATRGLLGSS